MSRRLRAILDLLQEPEQDRRLIAQLRGQPQLLRQLYSFARRQGAIPRPLEALVLERYSTELIEAFAVVDQLEEGLWLLPRLENLPADYATPGRACLDALADRLSGVCDAGELARVLQDEYCYSCDPFGHGRPANSFLPAVMATRCGLPLVVTSLWQILARRLGLDAVVLVFPGHVFGRTGPRYLEFATRRYDLGLADLRECAEQQGRQQFRKFLVAADHRRILQKVCLNLAITYRHRGALLRCNLAILAGQALAS